MIWTEWLSPWTQLESIFWGQVRELFSPTVLLQSHAVLKKNAGLWHFHIFQTQKLLQYFIRPLIIINYKRSLWMNKITWKRNAVTHTWFDESTGCYLLYKDTDIWWFDTTEHGVNRNVKYDKYEAHTHHRSLLKTNCHCFWCLVSLITELDWPAGKNISASVSRDDVCVLWCMHTWVSCKEHSVAYYNHRMT